MRDYRLALALAIGVLGAGTASAQTVTAIQGGATVGNKPLSVNAQLRPGEQVMVRPGGSAIVTYSDNCSIRVQPGTVFSAPAVSPCSNAAAQSGMVYDDRTGQWVVAGLALTAVIGGVIAATQLNRNSTPFIPVLPPLSP